MNCNMPGFPVLHHLSELAQTYVHWVGDVIQTFSPLASPSAPAFNLSQHHGLSQWVGSLNEVIRALQLQLQHQFFQWIFRVDLLEDLLVWLFAVQGTLKSLLQHHNLKASFLWCSAFFMVQLSHPYMTTGKTVVLTEWTVVGKVVSLLFNMLSRLVIAFLPRSKQLLIPWLQSLPTVILEAKKIKSVTAALT